MIRKWLSSLNHDEFPLTESDGPDAFSRQLALWIFAGAYLCLLLMIWQFWDVLWYMHRDGSGFLTELSRWLNANYKMLRIGLGVLLGTLLISPWFLWGKWWLRTVQGMSLHGESGWLVTMIMTVGSVLLFTIAGWVTDAWALDVTENTWWADYLVGVLAQQLWLQLFGLPLLLMGTGIMNDQRWQDANLSRDIDMRQRYRVKGWRDWLVVVLVAVLFAGIHTPNWWLVGVTGIGGGMWAWFLLRYGNGFAVVVNHVMLGMVLMLTLGGGVMERLAVGWPMLERHLGL